MSDLVRIVVELNVSAVNNTVVFVLHNCDNERVFFNPIISDDIWGKMLVPSNYLGLATDTMYAHLFSWIVIDSDRTK